MTETRISAITCPFVPTHIVPYDRFIIHVDKCKYPGKIHYSKCRFNPYHIIHNDEIVHHQKNCTQRQKYNPLEDDENDWFGVEQKSQKLETQVENPSLDHPEEEEQTKLQSERNVGQKKSKYVNNQYKKVEILDFDCLDFGFQGI